MRAVTFVLACALAATAPFATGIAANNRNAEALTFTAARVTLEGTSNIHGFTATTTAIHVKELSVANAGEGEALDQVLRPGALERLEIVIPTTTLSSPRDGVDKNMHKALKAQDYPEIRFRLKGLEVAGDAYRVTGLLSIAGVEKDVTLAVRAERKGATLAVTGTTDLLMTDFGITPPKAMLGMLRTNAKVQIRIDLVVAPAGS